MGIPKIVILGAGYGGMMAAKGLQKELNYNEAEVTLVNQNEYHYITTKLHEPAAGTVDAKDAQVHIPSVLDTKKINFIKDRVTSIDTHEKQVHLQSHESLKYDYLIVGLGSSPETFGIKGLLENSFVIRDIDSVRMIRQHMEYMFSRYAREQKEELITIVVGGAGFTGIEYVGELVDRLPDLCEEFDVPREKVRLINIEAAPTILPGFDKDLVDYAVKYYESQGVQILIGTPIEEVTKDQVILKGGNEIKAATIVWTGGVRGNGIVEESGFNTLRGRVKVDECLRAPGLKNVFVVGDSSLVLNEEERPYPPTAQLATQQGQYLGKYLVKLLRESEGGTFTYDPKGVVASLGRKDAIGIVGGRKLFGTIALLMKRVIDLRWLYLLGGVKLVLRKGRL